MLQAVKALSANSSVDVELHAPRGQKGKHIVSLSLAYSGKVSGIGKLIGRKSKGQGQRQSQHRKRKGQSEEVDEKKANDDETGMARSLHLQNLREKYAKVQLSELRTAANDFFEIPENAALVFNDLSTGRGIILSKSLSEALAVWNANAAMRQQKWETKVLNRCIAALLRQSSASTGDDIDEAVKHANILWQMGMVDSFYPLICF